MKLTVPVKETIGIYKKDKTRMLSVAPLGLNGSNNWLGVNSRTGDTSTAVGLIEIKWVKNEKKNVGLVVLRQYPNTKRLYKVSKKKTKIGIFFKSKIENMMIV